MDSLKRFISPPKIEFLVEQKPRCKRKIKISFDLVKKKSWNVQSQEFINEIKQ